MIIYKAINSKNNKVYIGLTTQSLDKRITEHTYSKDSSYFHRAITKYGIDNFLWEVIDESATTLDELKKKEQYYIKFYNSHSTKNGYNMTWGGDTTWELGSAAKRKLVSLFDLDGNYIKTYSSLTSGANDVDIPLNRVSYSAVNGHPTNNMRWQFGDSTEYMHSLRTRGNIVYQFDTNGKIIGEYENANVASECTGICALTIRNVLRGDTNSAGGYFWSLNRNQNFDGIKVRKPIDRRPIIQKDANGNVIKEYKNYSAITKCGTYRAQIRARIGDSKMCKNGFYWSRKQ